MLRSIIGCCTLMIFSTIFESTWLHVLAIDSVLPDISLFILIYISFKNTKPHGQIAGFISGILHDGISSSPLGLTSCIRVLVAWAFNIAAGKFFIDRFLLPALFALIATLLKVFSLYLFHFIFGDIVSTYSIFGKTLWIEVAYNSLISPVIFFILGLFGNFIVLKDNKI